MKPFDLFIAKLPEEAANTTLALCEIISKNCAHLQLRMAYGIPFFYYKKGLCYLNPKKQGIDVGFVQGHVLQPRPEFISEKRKWVRSIFVRFDEDINVKLLNEVVSEAIALQERR